MALSAEMLALLNKKKQQIAARSTGEKAAQLKDGKNRLRVLPATDGGQWWHDFGMHWIKPSLEKGVKPLAVIGCSTATYDQPCEICDGLARAIHHTTDDDQLAVLADAKKVTARVLVVALHTLSDKPAEPLITELPTSVYTAMINTILEYADEVGDVIDLVNGIDFIVEKTGKGLDTEYTTMAAPKASAVPAAVQKMVKDGTLPSLAEYVTRQGQFDVKLTAAISAISTISGLPPAIGSSTTARMLTSSKPAAVKAPPVIESTAEEIAEPAEQPAPVVTRAAVKAPVVTKAPVVPSDDEDEIAKALAELELDS